MIFCVALFGLVGNFVLYLVALGFTSPTVNQTVVSSFRQCSCCWAGWLSSKRNSLPANGSALACSTVGLVLFFNQRLGELAISAVGARPGRCAAGNCRNHLGDYGLAQKSLLKHLTSPQILVLIYTGATIVLLPVASPGEIRELTTLHAWTLAFCCANTLIAYGAFVEALEHWEVSRVSAVLTLAPLFTMMSMALVSPCARAARTRRDSTRPVSWVRFWSLADRPCARWV